MPEVAFIGSGPPASLQELARSLREELDRQGIPSSLAGERFPAPRPGLAYALIDPRSYLAGRGPHGSPAESLLRRTVTLGQERPDASFGGELLKLLRAAGTVFDVDPRTAASMRGLGVHARQLAPGYSDFRDRSRADASRPIDVLSLGTGSPRRARCLAGVASVLAGDGRVVRQVDTGDGGSPLSRERRWSLLTESKVVLSVHRDHAAYFDLLLAVDAIHAGAVIVAEHSSGLGSLEPGRDLLVGAAEALPYLVDGLLRDAPRLARMRQDACERLRAESPFAMSAAQFRAALVDAVGAPEAAVQA